jgi:PAS domain S-box-containing protein
MTRRSALALASVGLALAVLVHALALPLLARWGISIGASALVVFATLRLNAFVRMQERMLRYERMLSENGAVYRVLFDQASDGIFFADRSGKYIDVNLKGAELLGMTRDEVLKLSIPDIVAPAQRDRIAGEIGILLNGATAHSSWRMLRKDGSEFPAEVSAKILSDGRVLGMVRDISERVALESQLRQAQKMDAIGTLAAGIAHDFNNLVAAIVGNAELAIRRLEVAHPARACLLEIRTATTRATDLVRQIVAFSRPREPAMEVVTLGKVVEEVVRLLRSTLPAGVDLSLTIGPNVPPVLADPSQLHQVLINLVTNAWQAMQDKPGAIVVALDEELLTAGNSGDLAPGRYASIAVRDDGKGMSARTRERIFDPFFTTKGVGEGTGLGLAIVHRIVRTHRGAIVVDSAEGLGTRIRILLPVADVAATVKRVQPTVMATSLPPGVRVVYIDDEPALVSMVSRHLEQEGCFVQAFESPSAALDALRAAPQSFDVLVTDYNMPKLSGLEVLRMLGNVRPDKPFVLTSGSIDSQLAERAEALGVRAVLQKPYSLLELQSVIGDIARVSIPPSGTRPEIAQAAN